MHSRDANRCFCPHQPGAQKRAPGAGSAAQGPAPHVDVRLRALIPCVAQCATGSALAHAATPSTPALLSRLRSGPRLSSRYAARRARSLWPASYSARRYNTALCNRGRHRTPSYIRDVIGPVFLSCPPQQEKIAGSIPKKFPHCFTGHFFNRCALLFIPLRGDPP